MNNIDLQQLKQAIAIVLARPETATDIDLMTVVEGAQAYCTEHESDGPSQTT